jgi:predicted lipid-binding transport protein (Tim44 family)
VSRLAPVLAAAAPLLLAACGGDDREEVEQTVRDFVRATDQRDVDTFCDELVTQEFLEESTGATGEKAGDACKQQLRAVTGLRIELVQIRKTEIDGDRAVVTAVLETQGRRDVRLLRLRKEDGDWKLAGGRGQ